MQPAMPARLRADLVSEQMPAGCPTIIAAEM
jgi:hypothetical protein